MQCPIASLEQQPLLWIHGCRLSRRECVAHRVEALRSSHEAAILRKLRRAARQPPLSRHAHDRIAKHRRRVAEAHSSKEAEDAQRRARYAHLDVTEMRNQAARRATENQRATLANRDALAASLEAKKPEVSMRREMEIRVKERRRAEIYALNAIMRDHFRSIGAAD